MAYLQYLGSSSDYTWDYTTGPDGGDRRISPEEQGPPANEEEALSRAIRNQEQARAYERNARRGPNGEDYSRTDTARRATHNREVADQAVRGAQRRIDQRPPANEEEALSRAIRNQDQAKTFEKNARRGPNGEDYSRTDTARRATHNRELADLAVRDARRKLDIAKRRRAAGARPAQQPLPDGPTNVILDPFFRPFTSFFNDPQPPAGTGPVNPFDAFGWEKQPGGQTTASGTVTGAIDPLRGHTGPRGRPDPTPRPPGKPGPSAPSNLVENTFSWSPYTNYSPTPTQPTATPSPARPAPSEPTSASDMYRRMRNPYGGGYGYGYPDPSFYGPTARPVIGGPTAPTPRPQPQPAAPRPPQPRPAPAQSRPKPQPLYSPLTGKQQPQQPQQPPRPQQPLRAPVFDADGITTASSSGDALTAYYYARDAYAASQRGGLQGNDALESPNLAVATGILAALFLAGLSGLTGK